ncbi:MAG: DNA recombination protein RmuC [Campylobacterota bacterium]|nr:DNA recombination protein RmuC [Campylobacterota bacterium]
MVVELAVLSIVLLFLSIGLTLKIIFQDREIQSVQERFNALSIEHATLKQKTLDQDRVVDEQDRAFDELSNKYHLLMQELNTQKVTNATLQTRVQEQKLYMNSRLEELQNSKALIKGEFEDLANKIFISSQKNIIQQNQNSLNLILSPVKEQLNGFKAKVEELYISETKERNLLQSELQILQKLNTQMSQDALNLTKALKGENKRQGNWGEMVLEKVLEASGLRLGEEYLREVSLHDKSKRRYRPDVVIKLPNDRDVIVDAKTSLLDYERYMSTQKKEDLTKHMDSIQRHIESLSQKRYEELDGINSLDFILMFIPISNALLVALEHDGSLYERAFKQKVVVVTPDTLLLSLRAIENAWRYEKQAKNAMEVSRLAQKLYGKVKSFVDDLDGVGVALERAKSSYDSAYSKLYSGKDNIIRQIEVFKTKANIKPKESISRELNEKSLL